MMNDLEADHAALGHAYKEGRIPEGEWQGRLSEIVGLRRYVRQAWHTEMIDHKRQNSSRDDRRKQGAPMTNVHGRRPNSMTTRRIAATAQNFGIPESLAAAAVRAGWEPQGGWTHFVWRVAERQMLEGGKEP